MRITFAGSYHFFASISQLFHIKPIHRCVCSWHWLWDALVAMLFVEGAGDGEAGVGFKIEFLITSCAGAVFDGLHELVAVSVAFDTVGEIEFLQLGAVFHTGKFCETNASNDGAVFVGDDIIRAFCRFSVIKRTQMVELGIKISDAWNVQMDGAQVVANDGCDGCVVVSSDGTDDERFLIFHDESLLLIFSFITARKA